MLGVMEAEKTIAEAVKDEVKMCKQRRIKRLEITCKYCKREMPIHAYTREPLWLCGCALVRIPGQQPQSPRLPRRKRSGMSAHLPGTRRQGITAN